jgi:hypothetical protein
MYLPEKNTAEKPVVKQEVKTWKSPVNAIIWFVNLRFGSSPLDVPLTWPADKNSLRRCALPR